MVLLHMDCAPAGTVNGPGYKASAQASPLHRPGMQKACLARFPRPPGHGRIQGSMLVGA